MRARCMCLGVWGRAGAGENEGMRGEGECEVGTRGEGKCEVGMRGEEECEVLEKAADPVESRGVGGEEDFWREARPLVSERYEACEF